jgi:serine/threonine-protein kinase RsbT
VFVDPVLQGTLRGVRLVVSDHGPGIADVDQALTDGHTTGQGLGLGLGGARRLVDEFRIESVPGAGTTVTITMWAAPGRSATGRPASGPPGPGLPAIRPRMSFRP